ncbi:MAG: insulinase family protein, partial [Alistipes sp.]|nr:insulinase family protein [Alistipes sp.]
ADFKVKMQQPKVRVSRTYSGDMEYTIKNKTLLSVLAQILRMRYTESIREEKGGTYGVRTGANLSKEPAPTYSLIMQFDTNEQMADELSEILIAELRKIAEQGPKAEDVEKVREYLLKEWKKQIEQNSKWISMLQGYYNDGLDYMRDYENIVKGMTYDDIKALAKKIVDDNRFAYIVMRPEK